MGRSYKENAQEAIDFVRDNNQCTKTISENKVITVLTQQYTSETRQSKHPIEFYISNTVDSDYRQ